MDGIIQIKPEWKKTMNRHAYKCGEIQQVVLKLTESGLVVTSGDVKDLINNGTAFYDQIEQAVKSNAGMFKLPVAREKFISENTAALMDVIAQAKNELYRILAVESTNPMSVDAFEIRKGIVSLSESWIEELKESHTIRSTPSREKALELIANVEKAINELNSLVAGNRFFGTGISSTEDSRRCLMYISRDGSVCIEKNQLEFI